MEVIEIAGREFAVLEHVELQNSVTVPLLDIHMMDDQRERKLAAHSTARWKEVGI